MFIPYAPRPGVSGIGAVWNRLSKWPTAFSQSVLWFSLLLLLIGLEPVSVMAAREEVTVYEDELRSHYGRLENMTDLVAMWEVALSDGIHKIEFEHGTTSGKRVVYVDGKEIIRKDWMFKLVGKETFAVGASQTKATINIDAVSGFAYEYTLDINGKSLKKYMENRSKTTNTWVLHLDGEDCRVVLEKDTMDVWCNGRNMETAGEFVDEGTETHFSIGNHSCCIKAVSSGKRREGIIHTLIVDDREIPESTE
uniref:Fas apoptotic inhibitory molecule 1 n=1 Tax=Xenopus tropicalis TaxID=8364 RepID=A0A803KHS5_XENTR|eukprot:XP_012810305.1 PREDICTED: fas apoptotic inhibitory molecule 1 isoform X1 [Xenopus tropicalis]